MFVLTYTAPNYRLPDFKFQLEFVQKSTQMKIMHRLPQNSRSAVLFDNFISKFK